MKPRKYFALLVLLISPTYASAAQNSPEMVVLTTLGIFILGAFVIFASMKANQAAEDPENTSFATADNIAEKLLAAVNKTQRFTLTVVRQSGNVERVVEDLSFDQVVKQISQTMRRAKIYSVSIGKSGEKILIRRTMHNGKGRQEGKLVGGFTLTPIGR